MPDGSGYHLAAPVLTALSTRSSRKRFLPPTFPPLPFSSLSKSRTAPAAITPLVCDAAADERLLAWIRLGASSALLAWVLSDAGPGHSAAVQTLAAWYAAYAALLVAAGTRHRDWLLHHVVAIHAIDFGWTTVASTVGGGTGSHAFIYFAFVLAAAAFRWDLRRTLLNGALVLAVAIAQSGAAAAGITPWAFEVDVFLLRVSYTGCGMAVLFGILADRLHRTRHQVTAIAALVSSVTHARRLREALLSALSGIIRLMDAAGAIVVVEDIHTGRMTVWQAVLEADDVTLSQAEVPPGRRGEWFMPAEKGWCSSELRRTSPGAQPTIRRCITPGAHQPAWLPLPRGVLSVGPWRTLLALPFSAPGAWTGQIYVIDPPGGRGEMRLRFLSDIVRQITPGLLNVYLLRRLRSRAESIERGRLSRELHDTANQSLAAVDMRLQILRRRAAGISPALADDLSDVQDLVRGLNLDLRHFVERRYGDLDARRLPGALGAIVDRLSREAGIETRFEWAATGLDLPPHHCAELARIVQEALFNVRRHSSAARVLVRVESDASGWAVIIEDNGRGLGFTGRLSPDDPEFERRAPHVIRERAVALGGSLTLDSSSDGTRLEISFPPLEDRQG